MSIQHLQPVTVKPGHQVIPLDPVDFDYDSLIQWNLRTRAFPMVDPRRERVEYHRLIIESLLHSLYEDGFFPAGEDIWDIGSEWRRPYLNGLKTLNVKSYTTEYGFSAPDVHASITALPFPTETLHSIVCMETIEHIFNLFRAISELKRVLRPGGVLFATTPFMWPEHGWGDIFSDYWRLTPAAWLALLSDFTSVTVHSIPLSPWGRHSMLSLAAEEGYGSDIDSRFFTGCAVIAVK